jgi:hypothetical protein
MDVDSQTMYFLCHIARLQGGAAAFKKQATPGVKSLVNTRDLIRET